MLLAEKHQILLLQNTKERPPGMLPLQPSTQPHYTHHKTQIGTHLEAEAPKDKATSEAEAAIHHALGETQHSTAGAVGDSDMSTPGTPGNEA